MNSVRNICYLIIVLFISTKVSAQNSKPPTPYGAIPSIGQLRWHELEMYGFVHFTINTFTGKEWGMGDESPALFNPSQFDAEQIVSAFKSAGLKGLILTCKHHDGFCLWPTKTTQHNISKSPWKNGKGDIVKEFSDACKKQGLKFGVYLSPWDRNNKDYGSYEYVQTYRAQYTELLTNYGPIFEIWHDGANGGNGYYGGANDTRKINRSTYYGWDTTWNLARRLQPNATIMSDIGPDIRWVGTEEGFANDPCWHTYTPHGEQEGKAPAPGEVKYMEGLNGHRHSSNWIPAEVNFSIRPGWFYHENEDNKVKTPEQLFKHYLVSVGRGTTMLLNVPPDKRGLVHEKDLASLKGFGALIQKMYAVNFAKNATAIASNVRGNSSNYKASNVLDNDRFSYWGTDDNVTTGSLELTLDGEKTFNAVLLRENISLGQRIDDWNIDIWKNGNWQEYTKGTAIGSQRIATGALVTTNKVRIRITKAAASICLSEVALYTAPLDLLTTQDKEVPGHATGSSHTKMGWKVISTSVKETSTPPMAAIDNNSQTIWHTRKPGDGIKFPQQIVVDMGTTKTISAFTYLPRQDKLPWGLVDKYSFLVSEDGILWKKVAAGEFSNIRANPIEQVVTLPQKIPARYFTFVAERVVEISNEKPDIAIAELGIKE